MVAFVVFLFLLTLVAVVAYVPVVGAFDDAQNIWQVSQEILPIVAPFVFEIVFVFVVFIFICIILLI